ncbi:MAG: twitch domain-containing radical SAM protein [Bacteriovoracaceae bacterium]|nr:twitch domain-containing radical SAM protein [Bacteriovoracaceae bacterium]
MTWLKKIFEDSSNASSSHKKLVDSKYFCPLPWKMMAVRNNGDMRVCCQANTAESRGLYCKPDGVPYNVERDSMSEARNSTLAKELRKSMLEGNPHEACVRCDQEESSKIRSRRILEVNRSKDYFNFHDALEVTESDGSIDPSQIPLQYLDLRFGNKCNIRCRMCGPTDSNAWYNDFVKLWNTNQYEESVGIVKLVENDKGDWTPEQNLYDWVDRDHFWSDVEANMDKLTYIHTVGGEPLLIDRQFDLLQKCIEKGIAKNIELEYNTNGTVIPKKAWEYWKHFKTVKIGLSLDGTGALNDYIRFPSKWSTIEENINKLENYQGNLELWFAYTVQVLNVFYLDDILKWKISNEFKNFGSWHKQPFISAHPLHNPKHFNIKILPPPVKEQVAEKLRGLYPWLETYFEENKYSQKRQEMFRISAKSIIEGYINFMNEEDLSDIFPKFWKVTTDLDKIRGQSFKESFPEYYELLRPYVES